MGTNYYWTPPGGKCEACGHREDELHIGKSSGGWCFSLHVHPHEGINSYADWLERFAREGSSIRNEYGEEVSAIEMAGTITEREWTRKGPLPASWYAENHAQPGPRGLARHRVDGRHCIAQGEGTYDLMVGDFS